MKQNKRRKKEEKEEQEQDQEQKNKKDKKTKNKNKNKNKNKSNPKEKNLCIDPACSFVGILDTSVEVDGYGVLGTSLLPRVAILQPVVRFLALNRPPSQHTSANNAALGFRPE